MENYFSLNNLHEKGKLLTKYVYLEFEYLNIFLKCTKFARGERKKIHMEDSNRIDDARLFTENSLKVLYGN